MAERPVPDPPKKKKAAPKKKSDDLTTQENSIFKQMHSDISEEGKASPAKLKKLTQQVDEDQYKEDALTGMAHPDAQALIKAGVPKDTVSALAKQYAPTHPAAATAANKGTGMTSDPTDPAQYAADVLSMADLPDTASNEKLLETQMTEEGMPGGEDNPLATSLAEPGSSSVNSDGVQEYPNLFEGATAEANTLKQSNMQSIYDALKPGTDTASQYAQALANSAYEGYNPSANAAYANSYLTDAGQPEQSFPGGGASSGAGGGSTLGNDALAQASSTNLFSGLNSVIPTSGTSGANTSLQSALAGLSSSPEQATLSANTSDAPGSPDQTNSQTQQTNVNPASTYQAQLAALLGNKLQAGSVR